MIDVTTSDHHGHWDVTDIRRLCEYRDQLRGNLSLAEEGLANAMQEIENAKHDIENAKHDIEQLMASVTGEANEVERLRTKREIREFATWDDGIMSVHKWVPLEDYERLRALLRSVLLNAVVPGELTADIEHALGPEPQSDKRNTK
jgi:hypothetical protein